MRTLIQRAAKQQCCSLDELNAVESSAAATDVASVAIAWFDDSGQITAAQSAAAIRQKAGAVDHVSFHSSEAVGARKPFVIDCSLASASQHAPVPAIARFRWHQDDLVLRFCFRDSSYC